MLKGAYLQQEKKQQQQQTNTHTHTHTKHHSNHSSTIRWVEVFDITSKFPQSLGTSFNRGSTVLRAIRTVR